MGGLKNGLFLVEQLRFVERQAINELAISEDELMLRAGIAAFKALIAHYADLRHIVVFCGSGNNAGDAFVLARLALGQGFTVQLFHCKPIENLPPAALRAAYHAMDAGVLCQPLEETIDTEAELIVDGLLGIGLQGEVYGSISQAINLINDSDLPVLSLDIPSGLDADTGNVLGSCVRADVTISFIGRKLGMYTADGPDYCGKIICHELELERCLASLTPAGYLMSETHFDGVIAPRLKNSHKGLFGHVLVIGGDRGMSGAVYLAAMAALRVGAGKVTIATHPDHCHSALPTFPEVMTHGIEVVEDLIELLHSATVCVLGPGLGQSDWAEAIYLAAIASQLPLVMDASALRLLAIHPQHDDNWVLTPHPGEAACLLSSNSAMVQANRFQAAQELQQRFGGVVVLKGVGTLIKGEEESLYVSPAGNPGMASAGMGDVLSGVIGGLLAQGVNLSQAAQMGVWIHAKAGDEAAHQGERGIIASDLMPYLRRQINKWT